MTTVATLPPVIQFAVEPHFMLRYEPAISPSSTASYDSDGDERLVPFTLSPLDECRGFSTKKCESPIRKAHAVAAHKKKGKGPSRGRTSRINHV